jgi:hypothetical protein
MSLSCLVRCKDLVYTQNMARHTGHEKTAGGLSRVEPFYRVFNRIRCRITDPTDKSYSRYGGMGLTFEWPNYMAFKKDMYRSYLAHCKKHGKENTTIDRIDNAKGYSKQNCRWATWQEQARNKTTNRYITFKGRTMIIADWARELGVSRQALRYRLEQGWDIESIITMPMNHANKYHDTKRGA